MGEAIIVQFMFIAASMIFAYLAINMMQGEHSLLFPFFLVGSLLMLLAGFSNSYKLINLDASLITLTAGVDNGFLILNYFLWILLAYLFFFILWRIASTMLENKWKIRKEKKELKRLP